MLFYRKDLFEDPKVKRMYYEKYKKQLAVPKDFDSYNEMVKFFYQSQFEPFANGIWYERYFRQDQNLLPWSF